MIEVTRLWKKDVLNEIVAEMNSTLTGLGDEVFKIIEEAERRHEAQMLKLQITMLNNYLEKGINQWTSQKMTMTV